MQIRQIAIYGKGGIGKSTIAANISAALAEKGLRVMLVGCDPKRDSTMTLVGGKQLPPLLELLKDKKKISLDDVVFEGFKGVLCVEVGGPEPGIGCAGRGLILAFRTLEKLGAFEQSLDFIIYDVPGDVVCGGFAVPMREGFAREVYIVTSGEYLSLYAANNICKGVKRINARLGGIICNSRRVPREKEIVEMFTRAVKTKVVGFVPWDPIVPKCELQGKTVIEGAPTSKQAEIYRRLAVNILENKELVVPSPLPHMELRTFMKKFMGGFTHEWK
ncbi:MAG: Ni-sirohydrochlorin a,c-diamide reductive cyclase ATP-dependent reductase subunit [Candidatus Odinarchaeota archaeon]|nr:Ni-sirohydrochlorin a,c-diamide reductive cyclase ATP-dependent reductase subunit [Candidatus Odinarchaeota archaeon]MDO8044393.1 Ni-sirohydrochlorin a,c-diamide reductive cyclase ATP-dependent reductase subunit [Candidatus Baldrarchaeota archaeon]